MSRVEVYTKERCSFCDRAKALLRRKGVAFREVDVTSDSDLEREMIRRSGGRRTVPQIFVGGRHVGDSEELQALDAKGDLDRVLAAADAVGKTAPEDEDSFRPVERDEEKTHDVVVLGSGPAGLTAAIYCARADLSPVVIEGLAAGGQLMTTTDVENYPGYPDGIMGPEMMELFKKQAARFGTSFATGDVTRVDVSTWPFRLWTDDREFRTRSLIIATGASPRKLGIKGEQEHAGRGVSYCATCDGFFFRDQPIVVVGGGDSAMEEALFLTRFGKSVTILHRRDRLRASKIMADRALRHEKIDIRWDSVAEEVLGDGQKVVAVRIRNVKTDETTEIPCGGFFVAIGHIPNSGLFKGALPMDEQGYLKVEGESTRTSIPGVFAAGDVHDHVYRQAVTAAGEGCKAAIDCERWLESQEL